jgi:hypothetical protein
MYYFPRIMTVLMAFGVASCVPLHASEQDPSGEQSAESGVAYLLLGADTRLWGHAVVDYETDRKAFFADEKQITQLKAAVNKQICSPRSYRTPEFIEFPLHLAVRIGKQCNFLQTMIEWNANTTTRNEHGQTPLVLATQLRLDTSNIQEKNLYYDMARVLLAVKRNGNAHGYNTTTAGLASVDGGLVLAGLAQITNQFTASSLFWGQGRQVARKMATDAGDEEMVALLSMKDVTRVPFLTDKKASS